MSRKLKGNLFLLTAAFFWGSTFVAQEIAAKTYHIGAYTYQSVRMFVGTVVLLPLIFVMTYFSKKNGTYKKATKKDKKLLFLRKRALHCRLFPTSRNCRQRHKFGQNRFYYRNLHSNCADNLLFLWQ